MISAVMSRRTLEIAVENRFPIFKGSGLDLGSSHIAHRPASLVDLYAKFH